jgi:hypothetical protein
VSLGFSADLGAFLKGEGVFDDLLWGGNPILVLCARCVAPMWVALPLKCSFQGLNASLYFL